MIKTCKVCGGISFYKQGQCKHCHGIKTAEYRKKHPEIYRAAVKKWQSNHPDKVAIMVKRRLAKAKLERKANGLKHKCTNPNHAEKTYRGECKECRKLRAKAKYQKLRENKEFVEQRRQSSRDYAKTHREQKRLYKLKWRADNPDKAKAIVARRRAKKLNATPNWANHDIITKFYKLAALRTIEHGFKWEVDHIVPLQSPLVSGLHNEFNLRVMLASDNHAKGNRYWPDMWGDLS